MGVYFYKCEIIKGYAHLNFFEDLFNLISLFNIFGCGGSSMLLVDFLVARKGSCSLAVVLRFPPAVASLAAELGL